MYPVENIKVRAGHFSTGFIGTKDLMLALAKIGRNDVAYRLIHNDTFPSWGFSIKHGATSIWERWNGWTPETSFGDPGMNLHSAIEFPLNTPNTRKKVCHASAGILHRSSGWVKTVSELTGKL